MAVANTNLLELLGKQVSFSWLGADGITYETDGELTAVVFISMLHLNLPSMKVNFSVLMKLPSLMF